jgi:CheY-like chemotaxis protein
MGLISFQPPGGDRRMAKEILIADSDKGDQEEFQRIFETTDYHLVFSESGEDALLRVKLFTPDMIIASGEDLKKMSGVELCGALKEDPEYQHIPLILISGKLGGISEKDRQRVGANGLIAKPLNEDEILNLVDQLMEEGAMGEREEMETRKEKESLLDEIGEDEEEEEIIELVNVVEEPETRMSIHDFVTTEKQEPFGEITPLESWEKLEVKEEPEEKKFVLHPEKQIVEEMDLQVERRTPPKEAIPEEDLFEKIELEEILEKVEQLKPSLEKEWPSEKEVSVSEEEPLLIEEPTESPLDLSEFEAALQGEVKTESGGIDIEPLSFEMPQREVKEEVIPIEESVLEEELKEVPEEEFPDELLEEILGEEEIRAIEEPKEHRAEEIKIAEVETGGLGIDRLQEREIPRIFEEEQPALVKKLETQLKELTPLAKMVNKHLDEVIAKGVQDLVEDFITKMLPEMTQHIIGLAAERIEKMVREIVPDLAEKAIQEEIKRLQKGEKD